MIIIWSLWVLHSKPETLSKYLRKARLVQCLVVMNQHETCTYSSIKDWFPFGLRHFGMAFSAKCSL